MRSFPHAAILTLCATLCATMCATMCACSSREPAPPSGVPASPPPATTMVGAEPDAAITLRGRVSTTPWQHMMTSVPGKTEAYFDLQGGHEQTVVYWKDPPTCPGDVVVTGKVLEVKGPPKRPGGRESKADESHRELHVDVAAARCAE